MTHAIPGGRAPDGQPRLINRELSWLDFNRRVLEEAEDQAKPLIERVRFLAIVASNLDEFVMVRLAELRAQAHGRPGGEGVASGDFAPSLDPAGDLQAVHRRMAALVDDQYRCWQDQVAPALTGVGISIIGPRAWSETDRESLRRFYHDRVEPVLTPLAVDPTRPFPLLPNRGLTIAVQLLTPAQERRQALVSVPGDTRLIGLPTAGQWALAEDVVSAFLVTLFPGHTVTGSCRFRLTRDGSLEIDEDQTTDLLSEIEQELSSRDHGQTVRLELIKDADPDLRRWLMTALGLDDQDVVEVPGPLDMTVLFSLAERCGHPELREPPFTGAVFPEPGTDLFAQIRSGAFLLHHPYQSFQTVVDLVEQAASCPRVLAIKQTLYRVSGESPIVKALIRAARGGKQVTVLIELKARFDEALNIRWARAMEEAGAHVIYGLVGLKVHAKLLLIIRKDEHGIGRYVHIGTGNYNDRTAGIYTDISYITCNEAVGRDVAALFNMLTGYSQPPEWERLSVAPATLRKSFLGWIAAEAAHARAGRGGRIIAKFNSLVDEACCEALYAASQAGVEIDLIVRGMCILRPGVPGLSDHIRIRSLVGRFLEHNRIFWFANCSAGGPSRPVVAIASADWMSRNLDRRVECLVRIEEPALQTRLEHLLQICLEDNVQARVMDGDGTYRRLRPGVGEEVREAFTRMVDDARSCSLPEAERHPGRLPFRPQRKR